MSATNWWLPWGLQTMGADHGGDVKSRAWEELVDTRWVCKVLS